ncbi:MAG: fumarylacetoacetate hydrolase family protein, partial [Nitrospinales bacterium]
MKLLRFKTKTGQKGHGLLMDRSIFPLVDMMTTTDALGSMKEESESWNRTVSQTPISIDEVVLLPPVENPGAFLDFYTFEEHVKTARKKRGLKMVAEWYQYPVWYNGSTRCFSGDNETVVFPDNEQKKDFELELAIVIKKPCFRVGVDCAS